MDEILGTCEICGGNIIYIPSLNKVICDTCDYFVEEAF